MGAYFWPPNVRLALVARLDVLGRLRDQRQRQVVAGLVVLGPVDQPVLAEHDASRIGVRRDHVLQRQAEFEAGTLPWRPDDRVAVDLARQPLGVARRGDADHRVGVHVIDMRRRHEGVQRRVDRRRPRIEVEGAVRVEAHHVVLGRRLHAACLHRRRRRPATASAGPGRARRSWHACSSAGRHPSPSPTARAPAGP